MTGRRDVVILLGGLAVAFPLCGRSQQRDAVRRIGVLIPLAEDDPEVKGRVAVFSKGLRDLGWAEGRNVRLEFRYAAGDAAQMRRHAKELVAMAPHVMLVQSNQALAVLRQEDRTIPTVFVSVSDPVGGGFVSSLARPGGNATGFTNYEPATGGKWLQVLKELAPTVARVTVLLNAKIAANVELARSVETAGESLGVRTSLSPATDGAEIEDAIAAVARERNGGLIVMPNPSNVVHQKLIIDACARNRLPAVYPFTYMAKNGGLVGYGLDHVEMFRLASSYVDQVLKGASPAEMPVQQPTRYELVINLKTAKALGLSVPGPLLVRANEVIE